jgi:hypothetical protein
VDTIKVGGRRINQGIVEKLACKFSDFGRVLDFSNEGCHAFCILSSGTSFGDANPVSQKKIPWCPQWVNLPEAILFE